MDVRVSTTIERSAEEVFAYVSDPAHDPVWISGIVSAELVTEPPVGPGTQVRRVAQFLRRRIHYVLEIVDYVPGRLIAMRSIQAPFPMEVDYSLRGDARRTEFEIRVGGDSSGFYRLAGPLMALQVKRSLKKDCAALKGILERMASS